MSLAQRACIHSPPPHLTLGSIVYTMGVLESRIGGSILLFDPSKGLGFKYMGDWRGTDVFSVGAIAKSFSKLFLLTPGGPFFSAEPQV